MDIGAIAMSLSQMKLAQEVGVSVLKMAMDIQDMGTFLMSYLLLSINYTFT